MNGFQPSGSPPAVALENEPTSSDATARERETSTPSSSAPAAASAVDNDPETLALADLVDQEIVQAIGDLPEEFRSAIVLVDLQGLTYEEGARVLECPIGTVRSRLSRGRRLLEGKLAEYARERGYRRKGSV
ncbi:MAG: sigma factor-like helix-turn-helix DNA-binding protein [Candidatus Binatia bacterium]